jgi:multidrug efflux pump subunit AcrB
VVEFRYLTLACSLALLILTIGLIAGGRLQFSFMPNMDSDVVLLHAEYTIGKPVAATLQLEKNLLNAANRALEKLGGKDKALGFFSQVGTSLNPGGPLGGKIISGGHVVDMMVYLVSTESRNFSSNQFSLLWEKELGEIPGLKSLTFKSTTGPDTGKPISFLLKHRDVLVLEKAAKSLAQTLHTYQGLISIEDGISIGKEQLEFKLKDSAKDLGLSSNELGIQIKNAFLGAEALRHQRGRDEVKVMVRLPKNERTSLHDIEKFWVQTRQGEVPLQEVADIKRGISYSEINREDGARILTVSADIQEGQANANEVMAELAKNEIPALAAETPGLIIAKSGEQREQSESMKNLGLGFLLALILIYALLAIPLKSYVQPLIIMAVIPFGIIGASIGHVIMGFNLSIISLMGIVALAGIVVNDSLVLVHAANDLLKHEEDVKTAIVQAGLKRFRPILLTSLTTFFGLIPMLLETSLQARFLIPMAISIAFGVMFATIMVLVLIPALFVISYDFKASRFMKTGSSRNTQTTKLAF